MLNPAINDSKASLERNESYEFDEKVDKIVFGNDEIKQRINGGEENDSSSKKKST